MKKKIKVLISLGTRPEGIKLAPVISKIKSNDDLFDFRVCSTGQHREMLRQVLDFFEIIPDYDLDLMVENQSLIQLTSKLMNKIDKVFCDYMPDIVLVQGDTSTAFFTALAAFYKKICVGHVEAGLRTYDRYNPFPEEINRQLITKVANLHFAPTKITYQNLLDEGIKEKNIFLTGNTVVDAIKLGVKKLEKVDSAVGHKILGKRLKDESRVILVTMHRRESFGKDIENVCRALIEVAKKYSGIQIVYPVHLNPNIRGPVHELLGGINNIILIEPLDYRSFLWLMNKSFFIITDSGGVQEEAPTLKKPVLVIRKRTERMESVNLGISKLVGTKKSNIVDYITKLIENDEFYKSMVSKENPYGDGKASERILKAIEKNI